MTRTTLAVVTLLSLTFAGCLQSTVTGNTNGRAASVTGSAQGATSSNGSTGASSSGASATGGSSSGIGTTGSNGASATGGTSGGSTGDAGPCKPFGTVCGSNAECCTGACDGKCSQAIGQPCLAMSDCSSGTCMNDVCVCATPMQQQPAECATAADCCNGISCEVTVYSGAQYGNCCNAVGGSC